ncbi:MAG: hypothetical protein WC614_08450 [bacterium]
MEIKKPEMINLLDMVSEELDKAQIERRVAWDECCRVLINTSRPQA